jgi:hypothetical protein
MDTDPDKREAALLVRLELERAQRLAEKIAAGELIEIKLFIVAGSQTEARSKVEEAKASAVAELREKGDHREVSFDITMVKTGVVRCGEAADPASVPTAPSFLSSEDRAIRPPLPSPAAPRLDDDEKGLDSIYTPSGDQPPVIESYVCVQVRQCHDDDDPGEIKEGWFSIDDGKVLTVTDTRGKYVGSRAMLEGEDARVVAKQLLRAKSPESESFNRRLSYPNVGLA